MKAHIIDLPHIALHRRYQGAHPNWTIKAAVRSLLIGLGAALPALGIIVLAVWTFSGGAANLTSASLWATGFVFLALAVDAGSTRAVSLAATGLAMFAFGWLSAAISAEFGVLGAFLLAAWIAFVVARRLSSDVRA
ncbi:MAG: hypothetical protein GWM87_06595 [Xanthomonadales bacterium]|nr:hypothetical protein [Xanthomonadales bacterium]NIX12636.1 hypothetical protein [Xanthomonadales bacterium]